MLSSEEWANPYSSVTIVRPRGAPAETVAMHCKEREAGGEATDGLDV